MTKAEAEVWARDSVYTDVVHHITSSRNVASLEQTGFDLTHHKFGRVWGNGVYVATEAETVTFYETLQGYDVVTLEMRVNLRRLFTYDASQAGTRGMPNVIASNCQRGRRVIANW